MDILYLEGVRPFRLGGVKHHGHTLLSRGTTLSVGGEGTSMDILYFQGVRPFRLGGKEPSWTSFTSKGYDPLGWGRRNHHGHPLLPKGRTI